MNSTHADGAAASLPSGNGQTPPPVPFDIPPAPPLPAQAELVRTSGKRRQAPDWYRGPVGVVRIGMVPDGTSWEKFCDWLERLSPGKRRILAEADSYPPILVADDAPEPPQDLPLTGGTLAEWIRRRPDDSVTVAAWRLNVSQWLRERDRQRLEAEAAEAAARAAEVANGDGYPPELEALIDKRFIDRAVDLAAQRRVAEMDAAARFAAPPYRRTLTEQLAREREPVRQRIAGLADVGSNVLIQAKHKTGKTTLTANLLRSFADGEPFLGTLDVIPPERRIGLVNFEMSENKMDDWLRDVGITDTDRVSVLNLRGYSLPLIAERTQQFYVEWARDCDLEVLILDPWGRAMSGSGSENSNDDVRRVLEILGEIKRQAGMSDLYVLAHMGHQEFEIGQERARGASELLGWPDSLWVLTKDSTGARFLSAVGRDVEFPESQLAFDLDTRRLTVAGSGVDRRSAAAQGHAEKVADIVRNSTKTLNVSTVRNALAEQGVTNRDEQQGAIRAAESRGLIYLEENPRDKRSKLVRLMPVLALATLPERVS